MEKEPIELELNDIQASQEDVEEPIPFGTMVRTVDGTVWRVGDVIGEYYILGTDDELEKVHKNAISEIIEESKESNTSSMLEFVIQKESDE